jgi:hypothetical protein
MRADRVTLAGIATCALPVAAYSSWSQFETSRMTGVPVGLAWVMPMATDASATVATRVWLNSEHPRPIRRYAATVALGCMLLSVAGAATHLVLADQQSPPQMWLRLLIGGLPSLALAALVHLGALLSARPEPAPTRAAGRPQAPRRQAAPNSRSPQRDTASAASGDPPTPPGPIRPEPAIGAGSKRAAMLAALDEDPTLTGAILDQQFGTTGYGRAVVRAWRNSHRAMLTPAVGE